MNSKVEVLTEENLPQSVRDAQYAVRGVVVRRAAQMMKDMGEGKRHDGFDKILYCNIGNPQAVGNPALTYLRQVTSAVNYPPLLDAVGKEGGAGGGARLVPADMEKRSREYLRALGGSVGRYTASQGLETVRREIADYITRRDAVGRPCSPSSIFLTDGASPAIKLILSLLVTGAGDGIMLPIPQYPLYSATITLLGGTKVPYYLDSDKRWGVPLDDLPETFASHTKRGVTPRALVVINPGNPTGQVLARSDMEGLVEFCAKRNLVLMADEVYQENVYPENMDFISFRKVVLESDFKDTLQLVSFHSSSKGIAGECGKRGGYMDLLNFAPGVMSQILKLSSVSLCSNTIGQITMGCVVTPPREGEESYELYRSEWNAMFNSLRRRADMVVAALRQIPGCEVWEPQGAMYAFPSVEIPWGLIKEAEKEGVCPDVLYCLKLLESTGLCVVPGSGFGMPTGGNRFYFRTTFLPLEDDLARSIDRLAVFHKELMQTYGEMSKM
mmetsp:Transcript_21091/g.59340  ORF Transcript_21091/g.59340 Transcript_21091/m.59340 type:complete len:499 (+) Transcript_21091:92-1588(+)